MLGRNVVLPFFHFTLIKQSTSKNKLEQHILMLFKIVCLPPTLLLVTSVTNFFIFQNVTSD